jgi:Tol biopolymer transport system component
MFAGGRPLRNREPRLYRLLERKFFRDGLVFLSHDSTNVSDDRRPVSGMSAGDSPSRWSKDERTVYVAHPGEGTTEVYGVNLITGSRILLNRFAPTDRAGVIDAPSVQLTPDGRSYAYSYLRIFSDLYSIGGFD